MQARVLITGGSSGIGLAYAHEMARRGYALLLVSNQAEALATVAQELADTYHVEVQWHCMNLATVDAAEQLFHLCQERGWKIEVLINNAGIFVLDELVRLDAKKVETILLLHVLTTTQLCRLFGGAMKERRHGYILNMSSLSAWMPYPGLNLYASTKGYLRSFSRALRQELKEYGVSVTTACPGGVATDLYNLPKHLQNLAVRLRVMVTPQTLAKIAIRRMFRKKAFVMPGILNYLMIPLCKIIPLNIIRYMLRKTNLLPLDSEKISTK